MAPTSPSRRFGGDSPSVVSRSPGLALLGAAVSSVPATTASSKFRSPADCHRTTGNGRSDSISDASTTTAPTSCTPSRMSSICSLSPPVVYMPSGSVSHAAVSGVLSKHSAHLAAVVPDCHREEGLRSFTSQCRLNAHMATDLSSNVAPIASAVSGLSLPRDCTRASAEVPSRELKLPTEDEHRVSDARAASDTPGSSSSQCGNSDDGSPPNGPAKPWGEPVRQHTSIGSPPAAAELPDAPSEPPVVPHDVVGNVSNGSTPAENAQEILETAPLLESVTRLLLSPSQGGAQTEPPGLFLSASGPPSPQPTSAGKTAEAEADRRNLEMMLMMLTPLVSGSESDAAVAPPVGPVNSECSLEAATVSCSSPPRSASCSSFRAASTATPFPQRVQQTENIAVVSPSFSNAQNHDINCRDAVTSVSGLPISDAKAGAPNVPAAAKLPTVSRVEEEGATKECPTTSAGSSSPGSSDQSTKDGERKETGVCVPGHGERRTVETDAVARLQTWATAKSSDPQSQLSSVSSPLFSSYVVNCSSAPSSASSASSASLPSSPKLSEFSTATLLSSFIALPPAISSPAELGAAGLASCCGVAATSDLPPDAPKAAHNPGADQHVPIPHQLLVDLQLLLLLLFEHVCQLLPPLKRQDSGRFYAWHVQRLAAKTHGTLFHYSDMLAPLCSGALFPGRTAGRRDGECGSVRADGRDVASIASNNAQATSDKKDSSWKTVDVSGGGSEPSVDSPDETTAAALDALELCAEGRGNEKSAGWSLLALLLLQGLPSNAAIFQCVSKCPAGNFLKVVGALERAYSLYQMSRVGGGSGHENLDELANRGESCSPVLATSEEAQSGAAGLPVSPFLSEPPGVATEAEKSRLSARRGSLCGSVAVRSDAVSRIASPAPATSIDATGHSVPLNSNRQHPQQRQAGGPRHPVQQPTRRMSDKCRPGPDSGLARPSSPAPPSGEGPGATPGVGPRVVSGSDSIGGPEEEALATLLERPPLIQQQEFGSDLLFGDILKAGKEDNSNAMMSWQAALASTFGASPLCRAAVSGFAGRSPCLPRAGDDAEIAGTATPCFSAGRGTDSYGPVDGGHPRLFGYSRNSKRTQKETGVTGDICSFDGVAPAVTSATVGGKKAPSGGNGRKNQRRQQTGLSGPATCHTGAAEEIQRCTSSGSAGSCATSPFEEGDLPTSRLTTGGEFYLSASVNKRRHPSVQAEILRNCCSETLAERGTRLLDEVLQKLQGGAQQVQAACSWTREEGTGTEGQRRPSNSSRCSSIREEEATSSSGRRGRKSGGDVAPADASTCAAAGMEREPPLKCRRAVTASHGDPGEMLQPPLQTSPTDEERLLVLMRKIAPSSVALPSLEGLAVDQAEQALPDSQSVYAKTEADIVDESLKSRSSSARAAGVGKGAAAKKLASSSPSSSAQASADEDSSCGNGKKRSAAAALGAESAAVMPSVGSVTGVSLPGLLLDQAGTAVCHSSKIVKGENRALLDGQTGLVSSTSTAAAAMAAAGQDETMRGVFFNRSLNRWVCTWSRNGKEYQRSWSAGKYGYEAARQLARQCRLEKLLSGEAHTLQKGMAAVFKAPVGTPSLPPNLLGHVDGSQVPGTLAKHDGLQSRPHGGVSPHPASSGGSGRGSVSAGADCTVKAQSQSEVAGSQVPGAQPQGRQAGKTDEQTGRTKSVVSGAVVSAGSANATDGLVFDRCCQMLLEQELAVALGDVRALCVEAAVAKGGNPEKVKELSPAECSSGPVVAASRRRSGGPNTGVGDSFEQMMMLVNTCVDRDNAYLDVAAGNSSSSGLVAGTQGEMVFTGLPSKQDPGQFCF